MIFAATNVRVLSHPSVQLTKYVVELLSDGVVKFAVEPSELPPVNVPYQLYVPAQPDAESVRLPTSQRVAEVPVGGEGGTQAGKNLTEKSTATPEPYWLLPVRLQAVIGPSSIATLMRR